MILKENIRTIYFILTILTTLLEIAGLIHFICTGDLLLLFRGLCVSNIVYIGKNQYLAKEVQKLKSDTDPS